MEGREEIWATRKCKLAAAQEERTRKPLVTKGYYFDQGMKPTHKEEIIGWYEAGLDEVAVARRTGHAQQSVGRYLRDYERIKLLLAHGTSPEQIPQLIGICPTVAQVYVRLVARYHPELLQGQAPLLLDQGDIWHYSHFTLNQDTFARDVRQLPGIWIWMEYKEKA